MFGHETFIVRIAEDAVIPSAYVRIDPDEPAADGRFVLPARAGGP